MNKRRWHNHKQKQEKNLVVGFPPCWHEHALSRLEPALHATHNVGHQHCIQQLLEKDGYPDKVAVRGKICHKNTAGCLLHLRLPQVRFHKRPHQLQVRNILQLMGPKQLSVHTLREGDGVNDLDARSIQVDPQVASHGVHQTHHKLCADVIGVVGIQDGNVDGAGAGPRWEVQLPEPGQIVAPRFRARVLSAVLNPGLRGRRAKPHNIDLNGLLMLQGKIHRAGELHDV
mmetsp:Transcript_51342/g.135304  ORF Transcript_51342/g.135304 Transcript_51342/m.135304 type:complete len:229 (-) Transcript_51342:192-878(-)